MNTKRHLFYGLMLLLLIPVTENLYGQAINPGPGPKLAAPQLPGAALGNVPNVPGNVPNSPDMSEYFKRIQDQKEHFKRIREKINELKAVEPDSAERKALWTEAKAHAYQQSEEQVTLFRDMEQGLPEEYGELKNSIGYVRSISEKRQPEIMGYTDLSQLEEQISLSEENLKALTNERLAELGQDQLEGYMKQSGTLKTAQTKDFYSDELDRFRDPGSLKAAAGEKIRSELPVNAPSKIPGSEKAGDLKSKTGNKPEKIRTIKSEASSFKLFEANELKGVPVSKRLTFGAYINGMDAFSHGFNTNIHAGYSITQQLSVLVGPNWKKEWQSGEELSKEGKGVQTVLRYRRSKWLGQFSLERNRVTSRYPLIKQQDNFSGWTTSPLIGIGRQVSLNPKLQTVFMGTFDPLFRDNRRFHSSRISLRMGIEFQ